MKNKKEYIWFIILLILSFGTAIVIGVQYWTARRKPPVEKERITEKVTEEEFPNPEELITEDIVIEEPMIESAYYELEIGYSDWDTYFCVTKDLKLSETIGEVAIRWNSSSPDIINEKGKVTRPKETSQTVMLTATFSYEGEEIEKPFELKVIKSKYVDYDVNLIKDLQNFELLYQYNGADMEVYTNEKGKLEYLMGNYTDIIVECPEEAILSLFGLRTLMGMNNPKEEFTWKNTATDEYGMFFMFEQAYNGVKVYGSNLVITVDHSGEVLILNATYDGTIAVDTTPKIEKEAAKAILTDKGIIIEEEIELVIYEKENWELVWCINGFDSDDTYCAYMVSAADGSIIDKLVQIYE